MSKGLFIVVEGADFAGKTTFVKQLSERLNVKATDEEQIVGSLSGGNQQKVVLAKWIGIAPKVLILDEPT